MKLEDLTGHAGSRKARKRIGRGPGSGHGKTATMGNKGQKARVRGPQGTELRRRPNASHPENTEEGF